MFKKYKILFDYVINKPNIWERSAKWGLPQECTNNTIMYNDVSH